jgi:hypothetical protein
MRGEVVKFKFSFSIAVLLVEHESVLKFMEFAQNPAYLKKAGNRTATLEDSRL